MNDTITNIISNDREKESRAHKLKRGTFQESLAVEGILNLVRYEIQQIKKSKKINIGPVSAATKMAAAEQICTCANCIEARTNKTLSACEINKRMQEIYDSVIQPNPSNFIPELSPTYWKNVKSIRMTRPAF